MILAPPIMAGLLLLGATLTPIDETGYQKLVAAEKGKVVLVNFWATYCVPCRKEMPALIALESRLKAKGFRLITVSADEPEQEPQARNFIDFAKMPAPTYIRRSKNEDKFNASIDSKWDGALPASFLYDRQGKKVQAFFGEVDLKALEAAIAKLR